MASKSTFLLSCFFALSLLLLLNLGEASRTLNIHPPTMQKGCFKKLESAYSIGFYAINRYKFIETNAFPPTSQGHSPGVGHDNPPGAL
ncbi:hypothetical protein M5689_010671 [Euphorbia peplus]|nr:hypothetical protein M5689_010671 [Euphorbia peplus]